ncbi:MAG: glycosyltransferase [Ruminococcus sp.]|nr:glycosyltransferase [Ruminococcus sp.]
MCRVSVIVPVYKTNEFSLRRCIDCLTAQTLNDIEIILVDDGSPDRCGSICDEYAEKYPQVKVIHQENSGASAARNAGLDAARGEYIGFADADDYMQANMYEAMYSCALKYNADLVTTGYSKEKDEKLERFGCKCEEQLNADEALKEFLMCRKIDFTVWNKLFRKEIIENIRFEVGQPIGEDKYFVFRVLHQGVNVVCSNICQYVYVQSESSAMRSEFSQKKFESSIYFADRIDEEMKTYPASFEHYAMYARSNTYIKNWAALRRERRGEQFSEEAYKLRKYLKTVPLSFVKEYTSRKVKLTFLGLRFCPNITAFMLRKIYEKGS